MSTFKDWTPAKPRVISPTAYPGKGCGIWRGRDCSVWRNRLGGLTYRYRATNTSGKPWCEFTLFCEVGAPYQPLFAEFFEKFTVEGRVGYDECPYFADCCSPGKKSDEEKPTTV